MEGISEGLSTTDILSIIGMGIIFVWTIGYLVYHAWNDKGEDDDL